MRTRTYGGVGRASGDRRPYPISPTIASGFGFVVKSPLGRVIIRFIPGENGRDKFIRWTIVVGGNGEEKGDGGPRPLFIPRNVRLSVTEAYPGPDTPLMACKMV